MAERLKRYQVQNVVLDTVMLAKSGDPLLSASAVDALRTKLLPQVALIITPNLPEAAALLGTSHAQTEREMKAQGNALWHGCGAVLMKGGHLDDAESPDWLFTRDGEVRLYRAARADQKHPRHGLHALRRAGALRPRHDGWADTVREAKTWLSAALQKPILWKWVTVLGRFHHFHAWW